MSGLASDLFEYKEEDQCPVAGNGDGGVHAQRAQRCLTKRKSQIISKSRAGCEARSRGDDQPSGVRYAACGDGA